MTTKTKVKEKTITLTTGDLKNALQLVKHDVRQTSLSIIKFVKLETKDGQAFITMTDLNSYASMGIPIGEVSGDISILLPYRKLVKYLSGDNSRLEITVEKDPYSNIVTFNRPSIGGMKITTPQIKDYPPLPETPDTLQWETLDGNYLCHRLRVIRCACAPDESRPVLTGVCMRNGEMAAADGFRLHVVKNTELLDFGKHFIMPFRSIDILLRLFKGCNEIEFSHIIKGNEIDAVVFRGDNRTLYTQVIKGTYPDYTQLIPKDYLTHASFSSPVMSQRLRLLDEIGLSGIARLYFNYTEMEAHECIITVGELEDAEYTLTLPAKIHTREGGKIAVNCKYLLDAIKYFSMVDIKIRALSSPMLITGDLEDVTIVIMPMFVQW